MCHRQLDNNSLNLGWLPFYREINKAESIKVMPQSKEVSRRAWIVPEALGLLTRDYPELCYSTRARDLLDCPTIHDKIAKNINREQPESWCVLFQMSLQEGYFTFKSCIHSWHTEEGNILNKWTGGTQGKALQEIIQRARFTGVGVWRWSLLFRHSSKVDKQRERKAHVSTPDFGKNVKWLTVSHVGRHPNEDSFSGGLRPQWEATILKLQLFQCEFYFTLYIPEKSSHLAVKNHTIEAIISNRVGMPMSFNRVLATNTFKWWL